MQQQVGVQAHRESRVRMAVAHADRSEGVRVQGEFCRSSVARSTLRRAAARRSAHGAAHDVKHLFNGFLSITLLGRIFHAAADVIFKNQETECINCGAQSSDLLQDVDAVLLAVNHARNAAHLSLKSPQAIKEDLAVFCVAMPDMFCHTP